MSTLEENKVLVKKMQKVVYGILCDIDDFCKENHITYYLSGGTCLGAVRHQGFIPWDDDADIMMPRKDYERFLKLFPKAYEKKYGVGSLETDPEWQRQFARVWDVHTVLRHKTLNEKDMGIFIDIFPIDGLPSDKYVQKLYYANIKILNFLKYASMKTAFREMERFRILKRIIGFMVKPLGPRFFSNLMNRSASKYDFDTCKYVCVSLAAHYGERETIDRKYMSKPTFLLFENRMFPVPVGYQNYLSNLYGDYMVIPEDAEKNGYTHLDVWDIEFNGDE